jgi:predicted N-acetyltransferase YhbS
MAAVEIVDVAEDRLDDERRSGVAGLLAQAFGWDGYRARGGWRTVPPVRRLLAQADGQVLGQLSLFSIHTSPVALSAYGIGDVAVDRAARGAGLARSLVDTAHALCVDELGAELILVYTEPLATTFRRLGYRTGERFTGMRDDWAPDLLTWSRHPLPTRLAITPGDF